jgi:hypothetical protein
MTDMTKLQRWLFVMETDGAFEVYLEGEVTNESGEKEPYYDRVAVGFKTRADAERFTADPEDFVYSAWLGGDETQA